jgi:hypothetical protein
MAKSNNYSPEQQKEATGHRPKNSTPYLYTRFKD